MEDDLTFDDFFAEATGNGEAAASTEPTEAEKLAAQEAEKAAEAEKAKQAEADAEKAKAAEEAAAAATPKIDVEDIVAKAKAAAKEEAERLALEQSEKAKKEQEEADAKKAAEPSPEDLAAEKQFRDEWPTHAEKLDKQAAKIEELEKKLTEVLTAVNAKVDPILAATQEDADAKHFAAIGAAHADWQEILPDVEAWVAAQPDYLQGAYNAVLESGTAKQIIDFFNTFKAATGRTQSAADEAAEKEKAAKAEAERQKALHLAPVGSRRVAHAGTIDPTDFSGAFEEAVKTIKAA